MAGASEQSEFYAIFVNSGRMDHRRPPPGVGGAFIAEHSNEENRVYERWLARARPSLDRLLQEALQNGIPILRSLVDAPTRARKAKDGALLQQIDGATEKPDRRFRLSLRVSQRLTDEQQGWLRRGVAAVLEKHAA
jgi:hypothetical protein